VEGAVSPDEARRVREQPPLHVVPLAGERGAGPRRGRGAPAEAARPGNQGPTAMTSTSRITPSRSNGSRPRSRPATSLCRPRDDDRMGVAAAPLEGRSTPRRRTAKGEGDGGARAPSCHSWAGPRGAVRPRRSTGGMGEVYGKWHWRRGSRLLAFQVPCPGAGEAAPSFRTCPTTARLGDDRLGPVGMAEVDHFCTTASLADLARPRVDGDECGWGPRGRSSPARSSSSGT
jgi:hypothetical protein